MLLKTAARTPKRRDPELSRERVLQAGIRVFSERGPDAATVARISREAGLNRRMVYHYFGSKEGLYRAVLRRMYEHMEGIESEVAHQSLSAEEMMERIIRAYYAFLDGHPEFVRVLSWENLSRRRRRENPGMHTAIGRAIGVALRRGIAEGRFRADVDERQLVISCLALSFFYFSNRHTLSRALRADLSGRKAMQERVQHVLGLLLDGIRAGNGEHS